VGVTADSREVPGRKPVTRDNSDDDDDDDDDNNNNNNNNYTLTCKEIRVGVGVKLDNKCRYNHVPKSIETNHEGKVTILWNQQVRTDRTSPNNKPDVTINATQQGIFVPLAFR
jgi:hypothetical protein